MEIRQFFDFLKSAIAVLGLIGLPSVWAMVCWCKRFCEGYHERLNILMEAQQADMREKLLKLYQQHVKDKFISVEDLTEWENLYNSYHKLGPNGVMDAKREELMRLPSTKPTRARTSRKKKEVEDGADSTVSR